MTWAACLPAFEVLNQLCRCATQVLRAAQAAKEKVADAAGERAALLDAADALRQQLAAARAEGQERADALRRQLSASVTAAAAAAPPAMSARGQPLSSGPSGGARTSLVGTSGARTTGSAPPQAAAARHAANVEERGAQLLDAARADAVAAREEAAACRAAIAERGAEAAALRDELRRERLARPRGPGAWLLPGADSADESGWSPGCSRPATAAAGATSARPASAAGARRPEWRAAGGAAAGSDLGGSGGDQPGTSRGSRPATAGAACRSGGVGSRSSDQLAAATAAGGPAFAEAAGQARPWSAETSALASNRPRTTLGRGGSSSGGDGGGGGGGCVLAKRECEVAPELLVRLHRRWADEAAACEARQARALLSATAGGGGGASGTAVVKGAEGHAGTAAAQEPEAGASASGVVPPCVAGYVRSMEHELQA